MVAFGPHLRLAGLAGLPSWELVVLKQGEGGGVQIRLAIEEYQFSVAFQSHLHPQQDHMTVI
jgi:hypothetical protein